MEVKCTLNKNYVPKPVWQKFWILKIWKYLHVTDLSISNFKRLSCAVNNLWQNKRFWIELKPRPHGFLMRRHLFNHLVWSIFQSSLHKRHKLYSNGPSVWIAFHVLHLNTCLESSDLWVLILFVVLLLCVVLNPIQTCRFVVHLSSHCPYMRVLTVEFKQKYQRVIFYILN